MRKVLYVTAMSLGMMMTMASCSSKNAATEAYLNEGQVQVEATEQPIQEENDLVVQESESTDTTTQQVSEDKTTEQAEPNAKSVGTNKDAIAAEDTTTTKEPTATSKPTTQVTEKPEVTNRPVATKQPEANDVVVATKQPTATNAPTVSTPKPNSNGSSSNTNVSNYIHEVLKLMNEERAKEGLSALTSTSALADAAHKRATEIVSLFSHTRPDGSSPQTVLEEYNITYRAFGENIAYGQKTPAEVMDAWMNSEGHRKNIMSSSFGKVGIGCYERNGILYWTQVFTN